MRLKDFFKSKEERVIEKVIQEINKFTRNPKSNSLTSQEMKIQVTEQILSNPKLNTYFNNASREKTFEIMSKAQLLARRRQIEEAIELKAYVGTEKKELINLGFSEEEIRKIFQNDRLELNRLKKYSCEDLISMGIPAEDISMIKGSKKKNN